MDDYYYVGTIVSTHGIKGELKISSATDFKAERYQVGNRLFVDFDGTMKEVFVKSYREHKGYDLVSFENYHDINEVLPFVKRKIYVDGSQLKKLPENEYYYHELIGSKIYNQSELVGIVKDVVNYGASDIIVVYDNHNHEIMIPFVDDFIKDVDVKNKIIRIDVIEGLLNNED